MATDTESTAPQIAGFASYDDVAKIQPRVKKASYKKLRLMRLDPTIALGRWLSSAPIISSAWSVEATDKAPEGAKEFIDSIVQPLRFHLLRNVVYGQCDFGWQPFEVVKALNDEGKIIPRKLKPLLHDITTILIDTETGTFAGFENEAIAGEIVTLLAEDALLYNFEPEAGDLYGNPILEVAQAAFDKWNKIEESATRYDAKIAGAHLVIYFPIGKSRINGEEKDNGLIAKELAESWKASGYAIIPRKFQETIDEFNKGSADAWKIELLTDAGAGKSAFVERQAYLDKLKVRAFGLPERAVLEGEYGTKADAGEHGDFAIVNLELRHLDIALTTNWHFVNKFLRYNYGKQFENTVYIVPASISDEAVGFLRDLYKAIIAAPDVGLLEAAAIDNNALRERLNVPTLPGSEQPAIPAVVPPVAVQNKPEPLNGAQITSAVEILVQMKSGVVSSVAAETLLVALGIPEVDAIAMVQSQLNVAVTAPVESVKV